MKFRYLFFLTIILLSLGSCRNSKDLIYFQNIDSSEVKNAFLLNEGLEYKLRVNDILYVRIVSPNPQINAYLNPGTSLAASQSTYSQDRLYLEGYSVDKEGFINLPMIGKIKAFDFTVQQVKTLIEQNVSSVAKDATVTVKLANFRVTLLGEVVRPGNYNFYMDKLTIIDALGQAGDLTDFGNRKKVLLMRTTDNGVQPYRIDLTDKAFMMSDLYYLKPNDIIYVEPLKTKGVRMIIADYGVIITAITSTLTTLVLMLNLL
jgi:polysaccharide export outer membrane protein